jgi:xanthosine utilization system XapX-like protein
VTPYLIVLVAGVLVGTFGHIIKSRTVIVTGLLLIGLVSLYFGFVVAKVR